MRVSGKPSLVMPQKIGSARKISKATFGVDSQPATIASIVIAELFWNWQDEDGRSR
jgi:hypothetical protein